MSPFTTEELENMTLLNAKKIFGGLWVAVCASLPFSQAAFAVDYNWIGGSGTSWSTSRNWSPSGVPGTNDSVNIKAGSVVEVSVDTTVKSFVLARGATLRNSKRFTATQSVASNGLVLGSGYFNVPSGATAVFNIGVPGTFQAPQLIEFQKLSNKGTMQVNIESMVKVNFDPMDNYGNTIIRAQGPVVFKDIKNYKTLSTDTAAGAVFSKIENFPNGIVNLTASSANFPVGSSIPVLLEDIINEVGGSVSLKGFAAGAPAFQGKAIKNYAKMSYETAAMMLEADFVNFAGAEVVMLSGAHLRPLPGKLPKMENFGLVRKIGAGDADIFLEWDNRGEVRLEEGLLRVRPPAGEKYTQQAGSTTLQGGSIQMVNPDFSHGTIEILGGEIDGTGTINGDVVHLGGTVAPGHSPGAVVINGNYTQASGGTLKMEIGGLSPGLDYDQLIVNGIANLAGTLSLVPYNGYVPPPGASFQVVKYFAAVGKFQTVQSSTSVSLQTTQTPSYLVATAVNAVPSTPSASIKTPVNALSYQKLATATGTAKGTGLSKVTVVLYRYATASSAAGYWKGGSTWTATYSSSNDRLATGSTNWSLILPALSSRKYSLKATARDANGKLLAVSTPVVFNIAANSTLSAILAENSN